MSKSDFLSWDNDFHDFELDYLLGEFTDNELVSNENENTTSASVNKKPKVEGSGYKCPVCSKVLKTISGFRGHTSKQHNQHTLKGM